MSAASTLNRCFLATHRSDGLEAAMLTTKRCGAEAVIALFMSAGLSHGLAQGAASQEGPGSSAGKSTAPTVQPTQDDPFAGVAPAATPEEIPNTSERSWLRRFTTENFGFRK